MKQRKIAIILGHPAQQRQSFCESLALAYKEGAMEAGHSVVLVKISDLEFDPVLHEGYKGDQPPEADILSAQAQMADADHWVIVYPLWQFIMPALLKGFFERALVKGFAYDFKSDFSSPVRPLAGKTARIIQTMGMPGIFYRCFYKQHGTKAFRDMLRFCGISSRVTYCGLAESKKDSRRERYLRLAKKLGKAAA